MFCRIFFPRARWLELVVPDLPRRESRCSTLNVTKVQKEKYFDKDFCLLGLVAVITTGLERFPTFIYLFVYTGCSVSVSLSRHGAAS